jgi:hypothetical protein
MPTRFSITAKLERSEVPTPLDVLGLASYLLEPPHSAQHRDVQKPMSAWPVLFTDTPNEVLIMLHHLDDTQLRTVTERVQHRLTQRPRLGVDNPLGSPVLSVSHESCRELVCAPATNADWTVEFVSPTLFRRGGKDQAMPSAGSILRPLMNRWNTWVSTADFKISEDAANELIETTTLRPHGLTWMPISPNAYRTGFCGQITLKLQSPTTAIRHLLDTMMRFAAYSGIGWQTTHGLGAVTTSSAIKADAQARKSA